MTARWVTMSWPDELKGDPVELGRQAGLVVRRSGDRQLRVTSVEQYYRRGPHRLEVAEVLSRGLRERPRWESIITRWPRVGTPDAETDEVVAQELERLGADGEMSFEDFLASSRLRFLTIPDDELPDWFEGWMLGTLDEQLPGYKLVLLHYSDDLHARHAFIRAQFVVDNAPAWYTTPGTEPSLSAMSGLVGDTLQGSTVLLDALLLTFAPWAFGTVFTRLSTGMAVLLFGTVVPGHPGLRDRGVIGNMTSNLLAGEPLRAYPPTPDLDMDDLLATVRWWVAAMNQLIDHILDPTLFGAAESEGDEPPRYQAHLHMGHVATFGRFMASVTSVLAYAGRDEYTRRLHLFEALDVMEGLQLGGYDNTLSPRKLTAMVDELDGELPTPVARVLLPRCREAAEAITNLRDAFHPGLVDGDELRLPGMTNPDRIGLDKATAMYLRIVRNAGHGFAKELATKPQSRALIAAHPGRIPTAISDIPFLHLVHLLAHPNRVLPGRLRMQGS